MEFPKKTRWFGKQTGHRGRTDETSSVLIPCCRHGWWKGAHPTTLKYGRPREKRACENQVKKVTCLLGNGGRKIIWKPVTKKTRDFARVRVLLMWIRTRWLRRVRRWPTIRNRKLKELIELEVCGCFADSCFFWHRIIYEETPTDGFPDNRHIGLR